MTTEIKEVAEFNELYKEEFKESLMQTPGVVLERFETARNYLRTAESELKTPILRIMYIRKIRKLESEITNLESEASLIIIRLKNAIEREDFREALQINAKLHELINVLNKTQA